MITIGLSQMLGAERLVRKALPAIQPPGPFADAAWQVSDTTLGGRLRITVLALPADGGAPISAIEYDLDGSGNWQPGGISAPGGFEIAGLTDAQPYALRLRAVNAAGPGPASAPKTATPSHDVTAPRLGAVRLDPVSGEVLIGPCSEAGDFLALISADPAPMSGAAIEAALQGGAAAGLSVPLQAASQSLHLLDKRAVPAGPAWLHLTLRDAAGNYAADAPLAFTQPQDVLPPQLSAPAASAQGPFAARLSVQTDTAEGRLHALLSQDPTPPDAVQISQGREAGGAAAPWSGSRAVSATGAQIIDADGLSPATAYHAHFMHVDAAGNASAVLSAGPVATPAAPAWPALVLARSGAAANAPRLDIPYPPAAIGQDALFAIGFSQSRGIADPAELQVVASITGNGDRMVRIYRRRIDGSEAASLGFASGDGGWGDWAWAALTVNALAGIGTMATAEGWGSALSAPAISVRSHAMALEIHVARNQPVTPPAGSLANISTGATMLCLQIRENLPAGPTSDAVATTASPTKWGAAQLELF